MEKVLEALEVTRSVCGERVWRTGQDWRHLVGMGVPEKLGVSHEQSMRSQFHLMSGNLLRGVSLAASRLGA